MFSAYDPNAKLSPDEAAELGAKIRAIYKRSPIENVGLPTMLRALENEAAMVRGKHFTEWVNTLDFLRKT